MSDFKPDHRGFAIFYGSFGRSGGPHTGNYAVKKVSAPYECVLRGELPESHSKSEEACSAAYVAAVAAIDKMLDDG